MPDPVIVPTVPTVKQGEPIAPVDTPENRDATANVQNIFDRVVPEKFVRKSPPQVRSAQPSIPVPQPKPQPDETPTAPVTPPDRPEEPPPDTQPKPSQEPSERVHLPSFIEKALGLDEVKPKSAPEPEEWPEELPAFKTSDEAKVRYKNWRDSHRKLKEENIALRSRPLHDEATEKKVQFLENRNKEMQAVLNRVSIEHNADFLNRIIRPMQQAWMSASKTLKEVGGDPNELSKALSLTGKEQFQALDEIMEGVPMSAKTEINNAIGQFRRLDESRRAALADMPRTMQALQKADLERQYSLLNQQREQMGHLFDQAVKLLRDEAKVELLQKSNEPDSKGWNDQADALESAGRTLFMENSDMKKLALASLLAPMADAYRKLWLTERALRLKTDKTLDKRYGSEPTLSDSGGNTGSAPSFAEDLKQPFSKLFMRELQKQAGR